jgi:hypothetical protein
MRTFVTGPRGVLQSGDAATWVGSIGTLLAFIVALLFGNVPPCQRPSRQLGARHR